MSEESTPIVDNSERSGSADEKDGYVHGEDNISQYMNEAKTTGTASTSSPAITTMSLSPSGSQTPASSAGDECANENESHPIEDKALEQRNGTNSQHSVETIRVDQIDSVYARNLPTLSSTVSSL